MNIGVQRVEHTTGTRHVNDVTDPTGHPWSAGGVQHFYLFAVYRANAPPII